MRWRYCYKMKNSPILTFIGHASVKLRTTKGKVIYIDPFYPVGDYREPADYILITHSHEDHNKLKLCKQAKGCKVIGWDKALVDGDYKTFEDGEVRIQAVPSGGNTNHSTRVNVGYLVTIDDITVYHAGDTSMDDKKEQIAIYDIDYALYPVDGVYNMGPEEASMVAELIGAKHSIPIHGYNGNLHKNQRKFHAKGKLVLLEGENIVLS